MEWIIATALALALAITLPLAITAANKSIRGNSRMAGVALSIGLAFSMLYDPRKQEVIENIAKRQSDDEDHGQED